MCLAIGFYGLAGVLACTLSLYRMYGDLEMPLPHRLAFAVGVGVCWPLVLGGEVYLNWRESRS
jgi:hypothetical protein